jgi:hypothetical protein
LPDKSLLATNRQDFGLAYFTLSEYMPPIKRCSQNLSQWVTRALDSAPIREDRLDLEGVRNVKCIRVPDVNKPIAFVGVALRKHSLIFKCSYRDMGLIDWLWIYDDPMEEFHFMKSHGEAAILVALSGGITVIRQSEAPQFMEI